jgi:hypothetical protein
MPRHLTAIALALSTLLAAPAMAQEPMCGTVAEIEAGVAPEIRVQQGIGQMNGAHMTMTYATPDGATWTAVVVSPNGRACIVDFGTDWQARHDQAPAVEEGL